MCIKQFSKKCPRWVCFACGVVVLAVIVYAGRQYAHYRPEAFVVENDGTHALISHIEIQKDKMSPDALSIHINEYVQFDTMDGNVHIIGLGGGDEYEKPHEHTDAEFESGKFGIGESYRVKISKKGVYDFHDHKNPKLFATVIVY